MPKNIFADPAGVAALFFLTLSIVSAFLLRPKNSNVQLPPGPKGLPLVGNIRDLPPAGEPEYLHWLKHKDIYGPISSITVMGQTMVFIHDKKMALELMEKRSSMHSGRAKLKFGLDMVGWRDLMGSLQNNAAHRLYRKYAYQQIGSKAAASRYNSMQEATVGWTLRRMSENGGRNVAHDLKTQTGGLILRVLYDYRIDPHKPDPLIALAHVALDEFSQATIPGRWLVDIFPILAHVPEWFPGAGFKKTARLWKKDTLSTVNTPYRFAKQQNRSGSATKSFVSRSVDQAEADNHGSGLTKEQETAISWTASSLYIGGEDTSAETLNGFFLAMSMFPEVQRKAQEEIDRVCGTHQLPGFGDREQLPYVNAIVEEALRWHPIVPLCLPHVSDEEDSINGYRIPKDAILFPNVWWFTRDPKIYHDPESFMPERYAAPYNEPSPKDVVFGFGRRRCPGSVLADSSLYLTIAQVLAVFSIRPAVDEQGKTVKNVHSLGPGLVAAGAPFKVEVKPRGRDHEAVLAQLEEKYPWEESDAKEVEHLTKS